MSLLGQSRLKDNLSRVSPRNLLR